MNRSILTALVAFGVAGFALADEHDEVISKVMKEGMKGKTSTLKAVIAGTASEEETAGFVALVGTLEGTKAPMGDQAAYTEKIGALIAATNAVGGGDRSEAAISALKKASNCKACHSDHKP